jgi:uncharacterized membrane protein
MKRRTALARVAAIASVASAIAVAAVPWLPAFPLRPLFSMWLERIVAPLAGGHFLVASSADPTIWIYAIPGAVLCALSLLMLAKLAGKDRSFAAATAAAVGLLLAIAGEAVGRLGGSPPAATCLLICGSALFGLSLVMIGVLLRISADKAKKHGCILRWLRFLLVSAGGCIASFALFPLGMLLLVPALALGAFVLGREAARTQAQAP